MASSVADATAVNLKCIETILAKDVITCFINSKPTFIKGARKLNNPPF